MSLKNFTKHMLQRNRRAGDLAFSLAFLAFTLFLLSQLGNETRWVKRTKIFSQPAFWPVVGLAGMVVFGAFHAAGALLSERKSGRLEESIIWLRSVEFAFWFMAYVMVTPKLGYLPSTLIFTMVLTFWIGLRGGRYLVSSFGVGLIIVVLFKSFLQVKIPGGLVYEYLPDALRNFMILNF